MEDRLNKKLGVYSSLLKFFTVLAFVLCMLFLIMFKNDVLGKIGSYFSSIFIAFGFIPMTCSYLSFGKMENNP